MTTTEEKHPNDKKKKRTVGQTRNQDTDHPRLNKNNETPHYLHVKIQLLFRDVTP